MIQLKFGAESRDHESSLIKKGGDQLSSQSWPEVGQSYAEFTSSKMTLVPGITINTKEFDKDVDDVKRLYIEHYSWYNMPVTDVHKILMHGSDAIKNFVVPIGMLPEDAQETRTRDLRRFREAHTRKSGRINSNTDLMKRLLISSDPCLSNTRNNGNNPKYDLPEEVKQLLKFNTDIEDEDEWAIAKSYYIMHNSLETTK